MKLLFGRYPVAGLRLLILLPVAVVLVGCGGSPEVALKRGGKCLDNGNREAAVDAFTEAIRIDPNCKKAYLSRGMAYNELGKPRRAIDDFTRAIELDPRDSYPYEQRAQIHRTVFQDEDKAQIDEEKAALIRQQRWSDLQKLRDKR